MGKKRQQPDLLPNFFERFFGPVLDDGYVELRVFPNGRGKLEARDWVKDAVSFSDFVSGFDAKEGNVSIYFAPAIRKRKGGTKQDVSHTGVLWTEIDCEKLGWDCIETAKLVHDLPYGIQPSLCIHSGHGLHLYWYLTECVEAAELQMVEGVNQLLRDTFSGDNVWNIDRVMRVPWTWNTKGKPVQSRILWHYHWSTFDIQALHDDVAAFDSVLDVDGFVPRKQWEKRDAERRAANTSPERTLAVAHEDRRKKVNARGLRIWDNCRYGGGPGYVGLDEAIMLYTAHEYCRLSNPTDGKLEAIVQATLRKVEEVWARDASHEQWDWREETREIRSKLMRWVKRWDQIKASERSDGKKEKEREQRRTVASQAR